MYLENQLLLISINFTPKTSHSCLKNGTLGFPGSGYRTDPLRIKLVDIFSHRSVDLVYPGRQKNLVVPMKYGIFLEVYTVGLYTSGFHPGRPKLPKTAGFLVLVGKVERVWGLDRHPPNATPQRNKALLKDY